MNKQLASLGLLLPLAFQAQGKDYFTGIYLTGSIGATSSQVEVDQSDIVSVVNNGDSFSIPSDATLSATSPVVSGAFSYAYLFDNQMLLGGVFSAAYLGNQIENDLAFGYQLPPTSNIDLNLNNRMEIKLSNDFALMAKLGYVFRTTTLFYGFVGPRWGNFNSKIETDFFAVNAPNNVTASGSNEQSGYELGLTAGLGIQQLISPNYSWSLEYIYTDYGKLDSLDSVQLVVSGSSGTTTLTPSVPLHVVTNTLLFSASIRY